MILSYEQQQHRMLRRKRIARMAVAIITVGAILWAVGEYGTSFMARIGLCTFVALTFIVALAAYVKAYEKQ